ARPLHPSPRSQERGGGNPRALLGRGLARADSRTRGRALLGARRARHPLLHRLPGGLAPAPARDAHGTGLRGRPGAPRWAHRPARRGKSGGPRRASRQSPRVRETLRRVRHLRSGGGDGETGTLALRLGARGARGADHASARRGRIALIEPLRTASARSSMAVGCAFRMTTRAPASLATGTTPAMGKTESVEPTVSIRSQRLAAVWARERSSATRP